MSDHIITEDAHERSDILLQQAAAIAGLLTYKSPHADDPDQRAAAMIQRARDLIGHV